MQGKIIKGIAGFYYVYGEDEMLHFGAAYYPERTDCDTEFHLIAAHQRSEEETRPVKKLLAEAMHCKGYRVEKAADLGGVRGCPVRHGDHRRVRRV